MNYDVLEKNAKEVNAILKKSSFVSITGFLVLCVIGFQLHVFTYMSYRAIALSAVVCYAVFFITVYLEKTKLVAYFHYIFPLEIYFIVLVCSYLLEFPVTSYILWLFPVVYAALYAKRRAMLYMSVLTFITVPIEAYMVRHNLPSIITEIASVSLGLLLIMARLLTVVSRSRTLLDTTAQELARNIELQNKTDIMIQEVIMTSSSVKNVVEYVSGMVEESRQALQQIATSTENILTSAEDSNLVILQQSELVEKSYNQAVRIGDNANHLFEFAASVREQAEFGEATVVNMRNAIDNLQESTERTANRINRLSEHANEINTMSDLIQTVTKQIHIIAMNTGIEAARVKNGSAFQVIAKEIQSLAEQTKQASQSISQLAVNVQSDLQQIELDMSQNRDFIQENVTNSMDASNRIHGIVEAVDQIHTLLEIVVEESNHQQEDSKQVLIGTQELSTKSTDTKLNIETTAASAQQVSASVDELTASIKNLDQQSSHLNQLLEQVEHTSKKEESEYS